MDFLKMLDRLFITYGLPAINFALIVILAGWVYRLEKKYFKTIFRLELKIEKLGWHAGVFKQKDLDQYNGD